MNFRVPVKPLLYISLCVAFFLTLIFLDKVFGFHYEPLEVDELETEAHVNHQETELDEEEEMIFTDTTSVEKPIDTVENATTLDSEAVVETANEEPTASTTTTEEYFQNLISNYKKEVVNELPKNKARTDIVIRYYHHEPDGNSAYALGKLGYYIHEREVAPEYLQYQSNAIFYGDSVQLEDLQIVSYVLLDEGLPIKLIKPSKFHDSWKAHSIEIGTDTTVLNQPTITLKELEALSL